MEDFLLGGTPPNYNVDIVLKLNNFNNNKIDDLPNEIKLHAELIKLRGNRKFNLLSSDIERWVK